MIFAFIHFFFWHHIPFVQQTKDKWVFILYVCECVLYKVINFKMTISCRHYYYVQQSAVCTLLKLAFACEQKNGSNSDNCCTFSNLFIRLEEEKKQQQTKWSVYDHSWSVVSPFVPKSFYLSGCLSSLWLGIVLHHGTSFTNEQQNYGKW